MDQRRVLLAFLLMAAVLLGSQWWYGRMRGGGDEAAPPDTTRATAVDTTAASSSEAVPSAPTGPTGAVAGDTTTAVVADTATPADTTTTPAAEPNALLANAPAPGTVLVETPLYKARIDPRGGLLRQIEILPYPSFTSDTSRVVLVPDEGSFLHHTLDLGESKLALDARTWAPSDTLIRLATGDTARTLTLRWEGDGRRMTQTWRFEPDTYVVDYAFRIEGAGATDGVLFTTLGPRLHSNEKNPRDDYGQLRGVALPTGGDVAAHKAKDLNDGAVTLAGPLEWSGLRNMYFMAVAMSPAGGPPLSTVTMAGTGGDSLPTIDVSVGAPLADGLARYRLYLGPQEYRRLHALGNGLDEVNQYGWSWIRWIVTPFAKWIVVAMLWLHRFIPSYGLVLITFGILVRLVMWPLTSKSYRSIQAMQKLQPEIQRLREQYKDDAQTMQKETMRLYRERKVNPLGGCLPNLLPMPILFALFFVFRSTIELRGQAFLWLPDLSQPDPIYVLPVFMGVTMYLTSKMTTTDPKQSAMTYVMPVVLTFVFMNLSSGLVLYYAFSNLLTFGQQWMLRRADAEDGGDAAPAPAG